MPWQLSEEVPLSISETATAKSDPRRLYDCGVATSFVDTSMVSSTLVA